jgi:hypothetical protein
VLVVLVVVLLAVGVVGLRSVVLLAVSLVGLVEVVVLLAGLNVTVLVSLVPAVVVAHVCISSFNIGVSVEKNSRFGWRGVAPRNVPHRQAGLH